MNASPSDITEFKPLTVIGAERPQGAPRAPARRRFASAPVGLLVIAFHVVLFSALIVHSRTVRVPLEHSGGQGGEAPRIEALILPSDAEEAPSAAWALPNLDRLNLPDPVPAAYLPAQVERALGAIASDQGREAQSRAGVEERERLRGLYLSQVGARLERVLEASFALAGVFGLDQCRAQILQSESGELLEIEFLDCGLGANWRSRLVQRELD